MAHRIAEWEKENGTGIKRFFFEGMDRRERGGSKLSMAFLSAPVNTLEPEIVSQKKKKKKKKRR